MTTYTHTAYGLLIQTPIPFPELRPSNQNSHPDVIIRYGDVPESLDEVEGEGVLYQANADQFLLRLDEIASYLVQYGNEIIIQPVPGGSENDLRLFLLGSCLGALLQQRGILALHASAIQTEAGAVLFTGRSGVGKSSILAALLKRGYMMLSDDVTGIVLDDSGQPTVLPAFPNVKIWYDAAEWLEYNTDALSPVRPEVNKYYLPAADQFTEAQTIKLHRIYILTTRNEPGIEAKLLDSIPAFRTIARNSYRKMFLDALGQRVTHFELVSAVANQVQVKRLLRPDFPVGALDQLADFIEADLES